MIMTQEQALKLLEHPIYKWSMDWDEREDGLNYTEAIEIAIAALRPVSREQVEKVWRGCEYCSGDVDDRAYIDSQAFYISENGYLVNGDEDEDICQLLFCPKCGRPLTDEAVEMVMERINEVHGQ